MGCAATMTAQREASVARAMSISQMLSFVGACAMAAAAAHSAAAAIGEAIPQLSYYALSCS